MRFEESDHADCAGKTALGCGGFGTPDVPGEVFLSTREEYVPPTNTVQEQSAPPYVSHGYLPYDVMRTAAEHELGHALGFDHSANPQDIMHPGWEGFRTTGDRPGSLITSAQAMRFPAAGWSSSRPPEGACTCAISSSRSSPQAFAHRGSRRRVAAHSTRGR